MALPSLTESELRTAIEALDAFKTTGLKFSRFDTELSNGKVVSFTRGEEDNEWVMK